MQALPTRKVDVIWNLTRVCPWDCDICCVDAVHVTASQGFIKIRSRALQNIDWVEPQKGEGSIYDQAARLHQTQKLELNLREKLKVLDHLDGFLPKIDISGGDPLAVRENFIVLQEASQRFGREQITLTATGRGLYQYSVEMIAPLIGELNFTYDSVMVKDNKTRPDGYAVGNLKKATEFAKNGVRTRGECPLTTENLSEPILRRLYLNLHDAGIAKLLLMRLFPSGRGAFNPAAVPTPDQYRRAIQVLREMEGQYGTPRLKLQCALKFFDTQDLTENPCDLVRESFGLMADGTLLSSPWAVNTTGGPLHDVWVLGNLAETPLREILNSEKVREYDRRQNENFGHCKIHAFFHSGRDNEFDRIFDTVDPLYKKKPIYEVIENAA